MKKFIHIHCSFFLLLFLCACGVKGPLYLPAKPPQPMQPTSPEPTGKLFIDERIILAPSGQPDKSQSEFPKNAIPLDNTTTNPSTTKN